MDPSKEFDLVSFKENFLKFFDHIFKSQPGSSVHVPSTGEEDKIHSKKGGPGSGPQASGGSRDRSGSKSGHLAVMRPDKGYGRILTIHKDSSQLAAPLNNLRAQVLKDGGYDPDFQNLLEAMDWEMANGVNDPMVAQETAKKQLEEDPMHYRKLTQKDTLENEEDPYLDEGFNVDIGSGQSREPGFIGLDLYPYDYGTAVHDVTQGLPFEDGSVRKVRLVNSLHKMDGLSEDPKPLLSEIQRVLMPGGQFVYEGPNDIYNYPEWAEDYPGFVLTNHESHESVDKSAGDMLHSQEFTRVALPDPATPNDAEPRIGIPSYDELPADQLMAVHALDYFFSDMTSSGQGNRAHGYPSQGALKKDEDGPEPKSPEEEMVHAALNPPPRQSPRPEETSSQGQVHDHEG